MTVIDLLANRFPDWLLKVLRTPLMWLSAPRAIWGMSLSLRLMLFTLVHCLVAVAVVWHYTPPASWWSLEALEPCVLVCLIPQTVGWLVRQSITPRTVDDERLMLCFHNGVSHLRTNGYFLDDAPIVLLAGLTDQEQARELLRNAGVLRELEGWIQTDDEPVHWFAGVSPLDKRQPVVYLSLTGVSMVSSTVAEVSLHGAPARVGRNVPPAWNANAGLPEMGPRGTYRSGEETIGPREVPDQSAWDVRAKAGAAGEPPDPVDSDCSPWSVPDGNPTGSLSGRPVENQNSRLEQLASLLGSVRHPQIPMHGLLLVLPQDVVVALHSDPSLLATAVKADLEALSTGCELRFPVTVLVSGMERIPGFPLFVDRLETLTTIELQKKQRLPSLAPTIIPESRTSSVRHQRYGKGADADCIATPDLVESTVDRACEHFEDGALHQCVTSEWLKKSRENRTIFQMVCTLRSRIRPVLSQVLKAAFCDSPDHESPTDRFRLGGVYFASVTPPAFLRSVLARVTELRGNVAWTGGSALKNQRFLRLAKAICLLNVMLLLGLLVAALRMWAHQLTRN